MNLNPCVKMALAGVLAGLLVACSTPPVPDWNVRADTHLQRYTQTYLNGQDRVATRELELARREVSRTGRLDLLARVELRACALQLASMAYDGCPLYEQLAGDSMPEERAYAAYLQGGLSAGDLALLPPQHRGPASGDGRLQAVDDPLARLVAAGYLLRRGWLDREGIGLAVETASEQGWRRPLLAWLEVQQRTARQAGDEALAGQAQRRINVLLRP